MPILDYKEINFVKRHRGSMPILLTSPHGGTKAPPRLPERKEEATPSQCQGDFRTGGDADSAEITEEVAQKILDLTGLSPYMVVATFSRKYIDANRNRTCAYDAPEARVYYDEYRTRITEYATQILTQNGNRGFLFDIHSTGQAHADIFLGTQRGSTLVNGVTGADLFVDHGLRQLLTMRWTPRVINVPIPFVPDRKYFYRVLPEEEITEDVNGLNGGFTVGHYSTTLNINCIQIELSGAVRNNRLKRRHLPADLAVAIVNFVRRHAPF